MKKTLLIHAFILFFGFISVFAQDDCASAVSITDLTGVCATSAPSNTSALAPGSCEEGANDTWFQFTAQGSVADITVSNNVNGWRPEFIIISSTSNSCADFIEESCNDQNGNYTSISAQSTGLVSGDTYWVVVSSNGDNTTGTISVCVDNPISGGAGEDCSDPIPANCGDSFTNQTTIGLGNAMTNWSCIGAPLTTPGDEIVYAITTDGTPNTIRVELNNLTDDDTYVEVVFLGSSCSMGTCDDSQQFTVATSEFANGTNFADFNIAPSGVNPTTYYIAIDSQGDGVTSFDIGFDCLATGIEVGGTGTGCTSTSDTDGDGLFTTWNGGAPPESTYGGETWEVCHNILVTNTGYEWLQHVDINVSACLENVRDVYADAPITDWGFYNTLGDWYNTINGNTINFNFENSNNLTWGDGTTNNYCNVYTFCYTADVSVNCTNNTPVVDGIVLTDDGIGGTGNTSAASFIVSSEPSTEGEGTIILPLEFTGFEVSKNENIESLLNWSVFMEDALGEFSIMHSTNGINFDQIAIIAINGVTGNEVYYFTHNSPSEGKNYYRIDYIAEEGKNVSSIVRNISFDSGLLKLNIYPNPVNDNINIEFNYTLREELKFELTDNIGKLVKVINYSSQKGLNRSQLDVSELSSGIYFLNLRNSAGILIKSKKIVK